MSAIGGLVYFDGHPAEPGALAGLTARLTRRGPDAGGAWQAGPATLTQRVLFTTPESLAETGPLTSADGALVITADARLDNRAELCHRLDLRDDGQPDAALILAAYARWGAECAARLLGDFAFAVWDARRQELFCARDVMGVRPLFYYHGGGLFAWASDVHALRAAPGVPSRLNEARLADYIGGGVDATQSFFDGLLRLPPAHSLTVSAAGLRLTEYWDLQSARDTRLPSDDAYAEAFREHLTEAVQARLRSAYPVGSMLSGGLDSTSIVCLARPRLAERGQTLHTFSFLFDAAPASDERQYMAPAVEMGGLEHHPLVMDPASPLTELEALLDLSGEPFFHMGLALQAHGNQVARAAGVRVLLDGNYGDLVVSHGNMRVAELLRQGRWPTAAREFTGLAGPWRWGQTRARLQLAWLMGIKPLMPEFARQVWRQARHLGDPRRPAWAARSLLNPAFAWRLDGDAGLRAQIETRARRYTDTRAENRFGLARLTAGAELYNRLAGGGLELRHPFLDRRLIEFCLGLPSEQRLRDGLSRVIQRNAMKGILPERVRKRRTKSSPIFSISRALYTRDLPRLAEIMQGLPRLAPWIDLPAAERDHAQLRLAAERAEYAVPQHWDAMSRLTRVAALILWLPAQGLA